MKAEFGMSRLAVFREAGLENSHELFAAFLFGPHTCPREVIRLCNARLNI
jgi:hypothetical protein